MNISEMTEKANDLFVLPESVTRLKACMDDQASSIDDISEIIAYDPALTTQLLRVSNSALYRFPNRCQYNCQAKQYFLPPINVFAPRAIRQVPHYSFGWHFIPYHWSRHIRG